MKIIHTSDWHLGARLGRHDRAPDLRAALRSLIEHAERERPELILHTGDLFDAARPPDRALKLGVDALTRLSRVAPTVVLAGNHDSRALFRALHAFAEIGEPRRLWFVDAPQALTVPGLDDFALACVPFVPKSALADFARGEAERFEGTYADGIRRINDEVLQQAEAAAGGPSGVVVYAAHLHVHGAKPARSERTITVGEDYGTQTQGLERAMYCAFGHIHDPQALPGGLVRGGYAGSLVNLDFGEAEQVKSAVAIEIDDDVSARRLPLDGGRPLRQLDGPLGPVLEAAEGGGLDGVLLKARVLSEDPIPDLSEQILARSPGCLLFDVVNRVNRAQARPIDQVEVEAEEPPLSELFIEWRRRAAPANARRAPDDAVRALFDAALAAGDGAPDLGIDALEARVDRALDDLGAPRGGEKEAC